MEKYLLKLIVENERGVMARIATLLSRKGYNIQSICVGKHMQSGVSSIILTIRGSDDEVEQAKNQLGKLINVIEAGLFLEKDIVERESALLKVKNSPALKSRVKDFGGRIILERNGNAIVEIIDKPEKVEEFVKRAMKELEVIDISRSGTNAIDA